mmetsp:Transcript_1613/g.4769  ORF Transcript_1613/g.4769 Transcript_1613/m.4769 type:complete len:240 (-) Transcript_1613:1566-2285(-)
MPFPRLRCAFWVLAATRCDGHIHGLLDLRELRLPLVTLPEQADVRQLHHLGRHLRVAAAEPAVDGAQPLGAVLDGPRERLQLVQLRPLHLLHAAFLVCEKLLEGDGLFQRHQLLRRKQVGVQVVVEIANLLQLHREAVELQAVLHGGPHLGRNAAAHLLEEACLLDQHDQALGICDLQRALLRSVELHDAAIHLQGNRVVNGVQLRLNLVLPVLERPLACVFELLPDLLARRVDFASAR